MEHLIKKWKENKIIKDLEVEKAFLKADRKYFVPEEYKNKVYHDYPLHIGFQQTISQPTTVAIMTQALEVKKGQKILDIGSGSGWQAAVLSFLIGNKGKVITIEYVKELAELAKKNLEKLKIKNVEIIHGDGNNGHKKEAPYDRIIMAAYSGDFPKDLIKQLKEDGIIIGPLGTEYSQEMIKARKTGKKLLRENLGNFIFVPLKDNKVK